MKLGKSLQELAAEIERQSQTKHDYVADTGAIQVVPNLRNDGIAIGLKDTGIFEVNEVANEQIAEHTKIPKPYYDRMRREASDLLATNVSRWFEKYPAPRLVRTLDGNARAFLSNSYRPLDHFDFASAILPVIAERKLQIVSCEITEKRLYIKAVDQRIERDIPVGKKMGDGSHTIFDTCVPAMVASNSEVGFGRLVLETGTLTRACTNLCWWSDGGMKKAHLGARHKLIDSVDNIDHLLTDQTRHATDKALWMQIKDVLGAAFNEEKFDLRCATPKAAAENQITGKIEKVVEVTAARFGFNDGERESIFRHLIEGGSLTQYGLHAAVTRAAQDLPSYDRATDFEYAGAKVLELSRSAWAELAEAA